MALDYDKELEYTIGRINRLREEKGITVQDLAYMTEMHRASMSRIISGRINITFKTLCKIADALEVRIGSLVR